MNEDAHAKIETMEKWFDIGYQEGWWRGYKIGMSVGVCLSLLGVVIGMWLVA